MRPGRKTDKASFCTSGVNNAWKLIPFPHTPSWHGADIQVQLDLKEKKTE
jgi:hypothetical protein